MDRIVDRRGLLRQSNHSSKKRNEKKWEEDDFYASDEDEFLDRTGNIEKKRQSRMKMATDIGKRALGREVGETETIDQGFLPNKVQSSSWEQLLCHPIVVALQDRYVKGLSVPPFQEGVDNRDVPWTQPVEHVPQDQQLGPSRTPPQLAQMGQVLAIAAIGQVETKPTMGLSAPQMQISDHSHRLIDPKRGPTRQQTPTCAVPIEINPRRHPWWRLPVWRRGRQPDQTRIRSIADRGPTRPKG